MKLSNAARERRKGKPNDFPPRKEFKGMRPKSIRVSPKRHFHPAWPAIMLTTVFVLLSGCVVSEPVPAYVPVPSTFDRAWSAAIGAAQDEGVRITSEDRVKGVISGSRGDQDVTVNVQTQADGNVRVEFSAKGPKGSDPGLAGRISRAYDRRMGR
jgi:hypothetical protein